MYTMSYKLGRVLTPAMVKAMEQRINKAPTFIEALAAFEAMQRIREAQCTTPTTNPKPCWR